MVEDRLLWERHLGQDEVSTPQQQKTKGLRNQSVKEVSKKVNQNSSRRW
jgi:hypothetical protein